MHPQAMTFEQMREQGLAALRQPLGSVGLVRFLQPSDMGWGHDAKDWICSGEGSLACMGG
jgi:hypothetical protein